MARKLKLSSPLKASKPDIVSADDKSDATRRVENSMARQILQLPPEQLDIVVGSLREGATPNTIATFFAEQGYLEGVTEKTFRQYVAAFRRVYPEAIRGQPSGAAAGLNRFVDPRKPRLDEEVVLDQVIRAQSIRLGRALEFEERTNLPMKDVYKDIEAMRNLLETRNKFNGGSGNGKASKNAPAALSNEASEALRRNETAGNAQDKMIQLTTQLIPLIKAKTNA